jgi:hypothetical protein
MSTRRTALAVTGAISLLAGCFYGCSSSSSSGDAQASKADAGNALDGAVQGEDASANVPTDGGTATGKDAGPVTIPSCVGTVATADRGSGAFFARVTVGAAPNAYPADFLVDFGSTGSEIDLSAFPTPPASSCDAGAGQYCTFADFDFFGSWGQVTFYTAKSGTKGTVRQGGILGTGFLSAHPFTLDYRGARIFAGSNTAFCSDAELTAAGFRPMTTKGFYAHDLGTLNPLSVVDSTASKGTNVPNVPTVKLHVGGVEALAELDTGFDDAVVPLSINVNEAYLAAIQAAAPAALTRTPALDLQLSTCAGVNEDVAAYKVTGDAELWADDGKAARTEKGAVLFVKHTPPAAKYCGGIGTWTVPAAQVGASFYESAGVVIFDAIHSRVWMPSN